MFTGVKHLPEDVALEVRVDVGQKDDLRVAVVLRDLRREIREDVAFAESSRFPEGASAIGKVYSEPDN